MTDAQPSDEQDIPRTVRDRTPNLGDALWLMFCWFTGRRPKERCCPRCGYPTRSISSGHCPECGADLLRTGALIPFSQATSLGGFLLMWLLVVPIVILLAVLAGRWSAISFVPRALMPYGNYVYSEQGQIEFDHYQISYNSMGAQTSWRWPWEDFPSPVDRVRLSNPDARIHQNDEFWADGIRRHPTHGHLNLNATCRLDVPSQQHEVWQGPGFSSGNWLVYGGGLNNPVSGEERFAQEYLSNFYGNQSLDVVDETARADLRRIHQKIMAGRPAEQWNAPQVEVSIHNKISYADRVLFEQSVTKVVWAIVVVLLAGYSLLTMKLAGKHRLSEKTCQKLINTKTQR